MIQLIKEATEMLLDRSKEEQDFIYNICKLDDDERAAIIFAYRNIHEEGEE